MISHFRVEAKTTVTAPRRVLSTLLLCLLTFILLAPATLHAQEHRAGGEANLILPDLDTAMFFGTGGRTLLMVGLLVGALGLAWMKYNGSWSTFWEIMIEWNPEYARQARNEIHDRWPPRVERAYPERRPGANRKPSNSWPSRTRPPG